MDRHSESTIDTLAKAKRLVARHGTRRLLFGGDNFDRAGDFCKFFRIKTGDEAVLSSEFRNQIDFNGQRFSRRQIWIVSEIGASQSWSFKSHFTLRQFHLENIDESEGDL